MLVGAFGYHAHLGRDFWFFSDVWDQLATRHATNADGLLRPHNDHLQLMPTLL